jgi:SHS2 domain-containing protein
MELIILLKLTEPPSLAQSFDFTHGYKYYLQMDSGKSDFILLDHTADLGIIVRGSDTKDLFEKAGLAVIHLMIDSIPDRETKSIRISLNGNDLAELMVNWLGEILYLFEGEKEIVTSIVIDSISPTYLDATLKTVSFDPKLHDIMCEIKAVTYHQLEVAKRDDHWEAKVIFDL